MVGAPGPVAAVVFDLLFTLVHPGAYPCGLDRNGWLAGVLGVDRQVLEARWATFEPALEAGRAPPSRDGLGPELAWVRDVAAECQVEVTREQLAAIEAGWDLTRRAALLDPPPASIEALGDLRRRGVRIGVLSNTHALELRSWEESPLAALVDVVTFSHEIGACKPHPLAYARVLAGLGVPAGSAAYVGDGSSDELAGARSAGIGLVVLADEAASRWAPDDLPRLQAQADASVGSLTDVAGLLGN